MKKLIFSLFITGLILGCSESEDDIKKDENTGETENPEPSETVLPDGYVVIEADTFYIVASTKLNDPNKERIQLNCATKAQLTESSNDGGAASSIAVVISTVNPLGDSGSLNFSSSRFLDDEEGINLYISYFVNTGHEREGNNYKSPDEGTFSYTVTDGTFNAKISELVIFNEADETETLTLSANIEY